MNIVDIAKAAVPKARHEIVGMRPGEKLHEQMIGIEDSLYTYEYPEHFKILPAIHGWSDDPNRIKDGKHVPRDFNYSSDNNQEWMTRDDLQAWIEDNKEVLGKL